MRSAISEILWRIRRLWSYRSFHTYLEKRCTNWDLYCRDFPTWERGVRAPYKCIAHYFFERGTGIGRTPMEAARRAIRNLNIRQANFRKQHPEVFPTPEETLELLKDADHG